MHWGIGAALEVYNMYVEGTGLECAGEHALTSYFAGVGVSTLFQQGVSPDLVIDDSAYVSGVCYVASGRDSSFLFEFNPGDPTSYQSFVLGISDGTQTPASMDAPEDPYLL